MTLNKLQIGRRGEQIALKYLKSKGYKIIERNFQCYLGELDLVAEKRGILVFLEIRTRTSDEFGTPLESVTYKKRKQLSKLAAYYLQKRRIQDKFCRFDIVGVNLKPDLSLHHIDLIENAFRVGE